MAATGHGAKFTFTVQSSKPLGPNGSISGGVTAISVDSPTAEIVDATGITDPTGTTLMVPTGEWRGGSVRVDFNGTTSASTVSSLVRGVGVLTFAAPGFSVTRRAILESANVSVGVGDIVKGSLRFVTTDWAGT